jgi:hypothetical protein
MDKKPIVIKNNPDVIARARRCGAVIIDRHLEDSDRVASWSYTHLISTDTVVAVFASVSAAEVFLGKLSKMTRHAKEIVKNTTALGRTLFSKKIPPKKRYPSKKTPLKGKASRKALRKTQVKRIRTEAKK